MQTNAGIRKIELEGDLRGFGVVKFDPKQRANIFGLSHIKDMYPVTMEPGCVLVHTDKGVIRFERKDWLYCYTPKDEFFENVKALDEKIQQSDKFRTGELNDITGDARNSATGDETSNERSTDEVEQECHVVETIDENKEGFTQREVNQAKRARELYTMCIKPTCQLYRTVELNPRPRCSEVIHIYI